MRLARRTCAGVAFAVALTATFAVEAASDRSRATGTGVAAAADAASPATSQLDLATLLSRISAEAPPRVRFVERHFIAVLDEPLDSTGELLWAPPDRLEKRTATPRRERLASEGGMLTIERDGLRRSVALASVPEAAALVESLRATLAGDRAALERLFDAKLAGSVQRWTLELVPREPAAARLVRSIRLTGEAGAIDIVETQQAGGDRSVLRILRGG